MLKWRRTLEKLQSHVNKHPERFLRWNKVAQRIILAHYEQIYGSQLGRSAREEIR